MLLLFSRSAVSESLRSQALQYEVHGQASLSLTITQSLLKLMSIESMIPSNHLVLCCPHLLLPSIFPSIRVFSNESALVAYYYYVILIWHTLAIILLLF